MVRKLCFTLKMDDFLKHSGQQYEGCGPNCKSLNENKFTDIWIYPMTSKEDFTRTLEARGKQISIPAEIDRVFEQTCGIPKAIAHKDFQTFSTAYTVTSNSFEQMILRALVQETEDTALEDPNGIDIFKIMSILIEWKDLREAVEAQCRRLTSRLSLEWLSAHLKECRMLGFCAYRNLRNFSNGE